MDAVKNDVKRLVKIELAAANRKFRMFASNHEGVYDRAVALAVEAIQVAAMARKFERSQRRNWPGAKEPHYDEEEK